MKLDQEHPRVRGENQKGKIMAAKIDRNIPACAGKTKHLLTILLTELGTSPRARGKRGLRLTLK